MPGLDAPCATPAPAGDPGWRAIVSSPRIAALRGAVAERGAEAVAEFWATVGETPLVEPDDEVAGAWRVTFLWRGDPALTRHVALCRELVLSELERYRFEHVAGSDVWHLTIRVPAGTRSEYQLAPNGALPSLVAMGEDPGLAARATATWIRDPLNPRVRVIPYDERKPSVTPVVLSLLELPDAAPLRWHEQWAGLPRGEVAEHRFASELLGNERPLYAYTPPAGAGAGAGVQRATLPLLVVFDGELCVDAVDLPLVLDNLIAAGAIPPLVALMVGSGTPAMRALELAGHEPFVDFLVDELLPWARGRWGLELDRSRTLLAGMSAGGMAAAFAALRRPDAFGKVTMHSSGVGFPVGSRPAGWLPRAYEQRPPRDVAFHVDVGLLEVDRIGDWPCLLEANRQFAALLERLGCEVRYAELPCGHDLVGWSGSIADALQHLLGPA